MKALKIVIVGAGNVATHLGLELQKKGFKIQQVYSRTNESAKKLADSLGCDFTNSIEDIFRNADLYFLALSDKSIGEFIRKFNPDSGLFAHTSGSVSIDVFKGIENYGVIYPLQTFSKGREINFNKVPLLIESNTSAGLGLITDIANQLSDNVQECDSEKRKLIHLAAVFVSNFTNHLIYIAEEIAQMNDIDKEIYWPLIEETISKAKSLSAEKSQTGPASRNDVEIMKNHLELLSFNPVFQNLYKELSNSIILIKENHK